MGADQLIEPEKPQEIKKPAEFGGKEDKTLIAQFRRSKERFGQIASRVRQGFGGIKSQASEIDFEPEQFELDYLSGQLDNLTKETVQTLETRSENQPASIPLENVMDDLPGVRTVAILEKLQERHRTVGHKGEFPVEGMLGDGDRIEGNQIDFTYQGDKTVVNITLSDEAYEEIKRDVVTAHKDVTEGRFLYQFTNGEFKGMSDCWVIKVDENTKIYISKSVRSQHAKNAKKNERPIKDKYGCLVDYKNNVDTNSRTIDPSTVRSLIGAVKIEVNGIIDPSQAAEKVDSAFQMLKIPDALVPPNQEVSNKYKESCFRWQHRLEDDKAWEDYKEQYRRAFGKELVDHLERREVLPGYFPVVDEGSADQYQKDDRIILLHSLSSERNLAQILRNGLFSTQERFKRGIYSTGLSPDDDFSFGSADNVFLRALPENANDAYIHRRTSLLIKTNVLDRTDWFASNVDSHGSQIAERFGERPAPEAFLAEQRAHFSPDSEIMIRRGIAVDMIDGVIVADETGKERVVTDLRNSGIKDMNGLPIDQFVKISANLGEIKGNAQRASNST